MKKLLLLFALALQPLSSYASITLLDKDQWKVSLGGFVEFDTIDDSTRSFTEVEGNNAVSSSAVGGQTGRMQFSIRNTRLGLGVEAPEAAGWKTKGYIEVDFLGYEPAPPGPSGYAITEASYFDSPTLRTRHAYIGAEKDGWQILGGQTWRVFGWQPYYFMPSVQVAPVAGMLYSRVSQARVVKSLDVAQDDVLQVALGVMKPPQRDAALPGLEGGLRVAFNGRTGGFTGGSSGPEKPQPMSLGVTGLFREIAIPSNVLSPNGNTSHYPASAIAVDGLLPVIASSDNKDPGNTLVVGGEFTAGTGYGDEFGGFTGNHASPLASGATATTAQKNVNLDGGIGDFDPNNNFSLIDLRTFNAYFQYHLPTNCHSWISGGYGRIYSDNVSLLTLANGTTGNGTVPYNRDEVYFLNLMHDFTKQLRVGFEYALTRTTYAGVLPNSADSRVMDNNRYQLSAFFIF